MKLIITLSDETDGTVNVEVKTTPKGITIAEAKGSKAVALAERVYEFILAQGKSRQETAAICE